MNVDPRESNFTQIAPELLAKMVPHELVGGVDELRTWLGKSRGFVPVWPYLLAAVLLAFISEGWLSNVTAGHRAQGDATQIRTGRLNQSAGEYSLSLRGSEHERGSGQHGAL